MLNKTNQSKVNQAKYKGVAGTMIFQTNKHPKTKIYTIGSKKKAKDMIIASSATLRQASSNHQILPLSSCHHDPQTAQNLEHDHDQYLWWSW